MTTAPTLHTHILDVKRGFSNISTLMLYKTADPESGEITDYIAGRIVYMNASGEFVVGMNNGNELPFIVVENAVQSDIIALDQVLGLSVLWPMEFWTTEYSAVDCTVAPNQKVTGNTTTGVLEDATWPATHDVVGIISEASTQSLQGNTFLSVYSCFLPKHSH